MNILSKSFLELDVKELFKIYELRSKVFIVEQNCAYQDVDEKDQLAVHVMLCEGQDIRAYARILPPGTSYTEASIGRVLVVKDQRGRGYGMELMKYCILKSLNLFPLSGLRLSAQAYLIEFYRNLGFVEDSEIYLEDGIPHVEMKYTQDNEKD